jgi:hypothetical protein
MAQKSEQLFLEDFVEGQRFEGEPKKDAEPPESGSVLSRFELISLCVCLLVATVGVDTIYGTTRFTFGVPILRDGGNSPRCWSAWTGSARC